MNQPLFTPKIGRESNGYLSLKSEQKPINPYKLVQHDKTTNPMTFSENMYNFLRIWHQVKESKIYFFHLYIWKWTDHLITDHLKVMRRINQSSEREEQKTTTTTKQKVRKEKYFFPPICMKVNWSFISVKRMRRIGQSSDFIAVLSNRSGSKFVGDMSQLWNIAT